MSGIDDEHINPFGNQAFGPFKVEDSHSRPDSQPALPIFAGIGKAFHHVDVLDGDKAGKQPLTIDQQQFFNLVGHQDFLGLVKRDLTGGGDQSGTGHDLGNRSITPLEKAEVPLGDDADQLFAIGGDRHSGDVRLGHHLAGPGDSCSGWQRDRISNDAVGSPLHLVDLIGLPID